MASLLACPNSTRFILAAFLALVAVATPVRAQEYQGRQLVSPQLIADTTAIVAGKPFTAGVLFKIEPGWHTYWQFGGDSGAPAKITWDLPAGFTAAPIQWPIPSTHSDQGDQLTYVYENELMLLVEITPPPHLAAGVVELKAQLRWLVCKELCIPGEGALSLNLPVSQIATAANTALFTKWRAQLPKIIAPPFAVKWEPKTNEVRIHVTGLSKDVKLEFFPLPPDPDVQLGHPKISDPSASETRTISLPFEGSPPKAPWRGVLATAEPGKPRQGWAVSSALPTSAKTDSGNAPSVAPSSLPQALTPTVGRETPKLLAILWAAFLGGLILNLMPCVLPVIALKIFGFMQQAGEAPGRVLRLGLAFVAGVFVFFLGLATLVVALQSTGRGLTWGFQFQNPSILATLIALVFVFALAMFGLFEITIGSGTATTLDRASRREGYSGAFVHGLFTTLLGTSCTAPLLGPVLGFAFVQPAHVVFLIFSVIAFGMSLPYFLLTWQPAWMRFLPKPGAWMERMKQFMGFILLGVVIWLLGVFGRSYGIDALVAVSSFLLVLAVAAWLYGASRSRKTLLLIVALIAAGWVVFLRGNLHQNKMSASAAEKIEGGVDWQPFSPERLAEALGRGQPVFIDFTADWCLNCKYNERYVIETEPVRALLREKGILALKADWTNGDPVITKMLRELGRVGVPAYVLYPGGSAREPIVLPEILTQTILLRALEQANP